jgi:undecaprenyl-diphosphatase
MQRVFFTLHRVPLTTMSALTAAGAALLAVAVLTSGTVIHFDTLASSSIHAHAADPLVAASFAVTLLGGTGAVLPATAVCGVAFLALRLWHSALALALAVGLTQLVVALLKGLVERPRPPANEAVTDAGGFSFPSGHSATSAALFGVLALVAARELEGGARRAVAALGVALIAAVGVSRLMLGAHYPTDVLAGWLTGGALALASMALFTWLRRALRRRRVVAE